MLRVALPPIASAVVDIRTRQKTWIEDILRVTGWTPTELARRADVDQTTITRFLNDPLDKAHLSASTIEKVSKATGWDAYTRPAPESRREVALIGDVDRLPDKSEILRDDIEAAVKSLLAGRNSAFPRLVKTRALETAGVLPGDICVIDQNERPRRGDIVTANVVDGKSPSRTETVLRIFEPPFLISSTYDAMLRKPLFVDQDHVVILGVVIGLFRPRLAAA